MRGWKKYQANDAQTSNPLKVTVMAFERCVLNMKVVKEKYGEFKFSEAENRIINTEQIIHELNLGLTRDEHASEEVKEHVRELEALYDWMLRELAMIREAKKSDSIEGILHSLQDLLDGYRGALEQNGK